MLDAFERSPVGAGLVLGSQLEGVPDRAECLRVAGEMLLALIPADHAGWNAVDLATGEVELVVVPAEAGDTRALMTGLAEVIDEHPMATSYLGPRARPDSAPRRLSDVATRAELERNRAYVDFLRPTGGEHQLTILTTRVPATGGRAWALARTGRDFTDHDLELATAVQATLAVLDRTMGTPAPSPTPAGIDAAARLRLTVREVEVLGHVGNGLTADAIARLLRISDRTVRKHLENAYRKLDCHDRLVAVQRARALGIIPAAAPQVLRAPRRRP